MTGSDDLHEVTDFQVSQGRAHRFGDGEHFLGDQDLWVVIFVPAGKLREAFIAAYGHESKGSSSGGTFADLPSMSNRTASAMTFESYTLVTAEAHKNSHDPRPGPCFLP